MQAQSRGLRLGTLAALWSAALAMMGAAMLARAAVGSGARSDLAPALVALQSAGTLAFFLLSLVSLSFAASAIIPRARPLPAVAEGPRQLALVAGIVLCAQIVLGALVRYQQAAPSLVLPGAFLRIAHGIGSMATVLLVIGAAVAMARATAARPRLRGLAALVALLVVAQALLGAGAEGHLHLGLGVALLTAHFGLTFAGRPVASGEPLDLAVRLRDIVALAKPRITLLVLITFVGGMGLAPAEIGLSGARAVAAVVGTILIVAAANALNMFLERDVDGLMARTRSRPLPTGRMSPDLALGFGVLWLCIGLPLLGLASNGLTAALGLLAFASYVFAYTPLKRHSQIALFVGALPGALPPLMGWTAATGRIDGPGLALFLVLFAWQIPHFNAIAMMRDREYTAAGLKIMPVESGERTARRVGLGFAILTVAATLALPLLGVAGWLFAGVALVLGGAFVRACFAAPRRVFGASIVYLMLLFTALGADRALAHLLAG